MSKQKWIVDVGAFHGDEGRRVQASLKCESEYPVLFVEADPQNYSAIEILPGDKKLNLAISPLDGFVDFYRYKPETGSVLPLDTQVLSGYIDGHTGRVAVPDDWQLKNTLRVPSRRLDSLFEELGIRAVRFLKIDTQGYDLEVIKSLGARIKHVDELVCEVQLQGSMIYQNSSGKEAVLDYLHSHGFLFIRQQYQSYGQELNMYFKRKDLLGGMEKEPLVSILTPTFRSAKFLEKCIQSVAVQEYPFVEHVVQDGGSDDGSVEILKKYQASVLWKSERDQGQSDGLNRALQRCRGDIIGVLNADDEFEPGAINWAVENFAKYPEVGVVYGEQNNIDENGNILFQSKGPDPYDYKKILFCEEVIPAQAAFIRRSAMEKAGFYVDVSRKTCPDYEMWVRLGLTTQMKHVPGFVARYRIHSGSEGQQANVIFKMVESKIEVVERLLSDVTIADDLKKLQSRAISGIFEWSAGHFLPPHMINNRWVAWIQLWKAFCASPSFRILGRLVLEPVFSLLGLDGEKRAIAKNKMRRFLRALDFYILGGTIYKYWYLPRKLKRLGNDH